MSFDNAADVAFFIVLYSAIELFGHYVRGAHGSPRERGQPWGTVAGLFLAGLCFAGAYLLHAKHLSYYLLLGWYTGGIIGLQLGAHRLAFLAGTYLALGAADIVVFGDRFWLMVVVWIAVTAALTVVVASTKKRTSKAVQ